MAWSLPGRSAIKVGICIATKGSVSLEWAFAFGQVLTATGMPIALYAEGHFEIDYARNDLVDMARKDGCSHVMFLDSDIFPYKWNDKGEPSPFPDFIRFLLYQEYPIVSGLYWLKRGTSNLVVATGDEYAPKVLTGEAKEFRNHTIFVDAVAIGCCLIDIRVFDKVPYPWFNYQRANKRAADGSWPEISEDYYFFYKARRAGFPVMVQGTLMCVHEGRVFHTWGGDAGMRLPS